MENNKYQSYLESITRKYDLDVPELKEKDLTESILNEIAAKIDTQITFQNFERVKYRMDEEGFDYCFDGYSNWEEIKDKEFHRLRLQYLQSAKDLRNYILSKNK